MQQKQDIKGFTLLELIVVVTIIAVISASGYPAFTNWKKDREVRVAAENISSMLSGIVAQTQRGSFPYVQFTFTATSNVDKKTFTTKGMSRKSLSSTLNAGNSLDCDMVNSGVWDNHKVHYHEADVAIHKKTSGAVCFSRDGSHFGYSGSLSANININLDGKNVKDYIILCDLDQLDSNGNSQIGGDGECQITKLQKPAYMVEWSRFGGIHIGKWSGSAWSSR